MENEISLHVSRRKPTLFFMICLAVTAWARAACVVGPDPVSAGSRSPGTKIRASYPDSARGLKQQLKDMRDLARKGRSDQLQAVIRDFEIPDAQAWYLANFGTSGLQTADYYKKNLARSEQRLVNQMIEFAREDGYFSVKKQNAKKAYPGLIATPEIFLAAWEDRTYGQDPFETPVGYFFFVDGRFCWDSTMEWVTVD